MAGNIEAVLESLQEAQTALNAIPTDFDTAGNYLEEALEVLFDPQAQVDDLDSPLGAATTAIQEAHNNVAEGNIELAEYYLGIAVIKLEEARLN